MEQATGASHLFPASAAEQQGQRAGVVSRTIAMVVDIVYVAVICGIVYAGYAGVRFLRNPVRFTWPKTDFPVFLVVAMIVAVLALTIAWSSLGRTMGMRIMGLRIQTDKGERVRVARSFLRALTCVLFPLGLFWSAVSKRNASVHDLVFRTSVIYDWESRVPEMRGD
ncbi:MAG TPA: RDD family protein [Actinomycetota bacterium]